VQEPLTHKLEVQEGGRIELQVPLPQGTQVAVFVTQEPVDDSYDLVLAFEDDLGLWDDDEEGWGGGGWEDWGE